MSQDDFPWGDRNPEGGFKIGDIVGLIYSDHEEYIFDNPKGVVVAVEEGEEEGWPDRITVEVQASISAERVYLIKRS